MYKDQDGNTYDEQSLSVLASQSGLDLATYTSMNGLEKSTSSQTEDATAEPVSTASNLENTSSVFRYDPEAFLKDNDQVFVPPVQSFTVENDRIVENKDPFPLLTEAEELRELNNKNAEDLTLQTIYDFKTNNPDLLKTVQFEDGFAEVIDFDDPKKVQDMHTTLFFDFFSKNEEIKNIVSNIEKENQELLLEKQQEIIDQYDYVYDVDESTGNIVGRLSDEDYDSAISEYNDFFSKLVFKHNRVQEISSLFESKVNEQLTADNNRYTVDKHTPNFIKELDFLGKMPSTGIANLPYFSAYNTVAGMLTSAKSASLSTVSEGVYKPLYKHYRYISALAENQGWTDETVGYVNDDGFFATDRGPASGFRTQTTWGEARANMQSEISRHQNDYTTKLNEVLSEREIQSAYQRASFEKMVSGENSLQQLKMMVVEQVPIMVSAVLSYGTIPAITEGAQVYEQLIEQEARKLNPNFDSLSEQEKTKMLYNIAMNDDGSLYAKGATSGIIIGQLERVGAKATLFPMLTETSESLIRGQYKNFLKNTFKKGVSGSFSESLTEGLQTFTSSAFTGEFNSKEFVEAIGMGGTIGLFMPVSTNVLKQTKRELDSAYRIALGKLDSKSAESFFNNQLLQLDNAFKNKKIEEAEYNEKRDLITKIKNNNTKIPRNFTDKGKQETLDILLEKEQLETVKKNLDPNLTEDVDLQIDVLNQRLKEVSNSEKEIRQAEKQGVSVGELRQEQFDKYFETTTEMAQDIKNKTGRDVIIEEGDNTMMAELLYESGEFSSVEEAMQHVDGTKGFRHGAIGQDVNGNSFIMLNKESSIATGKVTTAAHEFLHAVLFQTLKRNTKAQMEFGTQIINAINEAGGVDPNSQFSRRLATYSPQEGLGEEVATLLSESMLLGDVAFNENLFTKIKDAFRRFLLKHTGKEFSFDKAQDFYNFLKDYNKSLTDGKLREKIINVAAEGAKGKLITPVEDAKVDVETMASKEASDRVQQIYEDQGVSGAMDIINEFTPIVNRLVERRSQAPNFDRQLLTDEITTGKRGIFDLIQEYNPESGVPLAAYINKFLPARAIEASRRVLGEEFTDDVTEARGVAADETVEQQPERKTKDIVLAERLNIQEGVTAEVNEQNVKFSTLSNFKSVPNAVANVVGDMIGISPKKIKSKANLTAAEVASAQRWFKANAALVIQALPQGFDSSGKATGVPRTVLEALYNKRESRAKTKAGLQTQVKRTNIKDSELLELIDIIDGKPTRNRNTSARVIALADLLGKVITNQEIRRQNPELTKISDGMAKYMFSQEASDTELSKMLRQENKAWKSVVAAAPQNVQPIDIINSDTDLENYRDFIKTTVAPNFPKEFLTVGTFAGAGANGRKRNFGFTSKEDLLSSVEGVEFAASDPDITAAVSSVGKYGKLTGKTVAEKLKNFEYHQASRRGAKKIWLKMQEIMQAQPETIPYFATMFASTSQNMGHFARVSSTLEFTNTLNEKNVEEHTLPASDFAKFLFNRALQGNLELYIDGAFENYAQGSLPLSYDKKLKGEVNGVKFNFVSMPPIEYHLDILLGLKSKWIRYFNPLVNANDGGINPNYLVNARGETIAEEFGLGVDVSLHGDKLVVSTQQDLLYKLLNGDITQAEAKKYLDNYLDKTSIIKRDQDVVIMASKGVENSRSFTPNTKAKGMSTFDFDETLIIDGENFIVAKKDGEEVKISSGNWPIQGPKFAAEGWEFDFSDFVNVRGGVDGPLLQKMKNQIRKYGPNNVYVLTARPAEAATAIHEWLKTKGINIPFENITGLGDSRGDAKAEWMLQKYSEGYNDMYFVDDALPNVEAVQHVFNQLDVKGKSVQAKLQFSKDLSSEFNKMIERKKGVGAEKTFSRVVGQKRGKNIGRYTFFVPPSADDFAGLLYDFYGKGEQGNADMEFMKKALLDPFARADREMSMARMSILDDYKMLRKELPNVKKKLGKIINEDTGFTFDNAVRVYLFDKAGFEVPGISKRDLAFLKNIVNTDQDLRTFADMLSAISKREEGWIEPGENWSVETIASDLENIVNKIGRKKYLAEFIENKNIIFSPENMNKIEAVYGSRFRSALEDVLYRMENGTNRSSGRNYGQAWTNWVNGSVGAIMFFNGRSAVLQTLSTVNFINFDDNNIFKAGKALANQKQYWSDFSMLFNSDFLRARRAGLQINVNEAELANAVAGAQNKVKAALAYLLKKGFLPTQIADSFAIASGGATFYRNRIDTYKKQGLTQKQAEEKAFLDFQEIAQETQQSARPDRISQQQASPLGRLILAFANTPMQYNRLIKKAAKDLINNRGDWRSNVSRILYYGAIQNVIFTSLQSAIFALSFDDEEDDAVDKRTQRILNGTIDTLLRGSGVTGAAIATIKNTILRFIEESERESRADYGQVVVEAFQVSPPMGSKARKLYSALNAYKFNRKIMGSMDTFDYNNPLWDASGKVISAATNIPLDRLFRKTDNVREALNQENSEMQRAFLFLGWSTWDLQVGERVVVNKGKKNQYVRYLDLKRQAQQEAKDNLKEQKKQEKKEEAKTSRCVSYTSKGTRCKKTAIPGKKVCYMHD